MSIRPSEGHEQAIKHILEHNLPRPDDEVEFLVFTDASISEQGVVGAGWVICQPTGRIICESSRVFSLDGPTDIQEGEALAIQGAVQQLKAMDWWSENIKFYSDNKSVVESFERETKVWEIDVFNQLREWISATMVEWVKRDYNRVADVLSKNARQSAEASISG